MSKKIFTTMQSDLRKYNGQIVDILGPLDESKYDKEDVGPMFTIKFHDGVIAEAFEDELTDHIGWPLAPDIYALCETVFDLA